MATSGRSNSLHCTAAHPDARREVAERKRAPEESPAPEPSPGAVVEGRAGAEPAEAPGCSRRVLVVDDEEALRALLREVLEMDGHSVTEAANGTRALEAVAEDDFDLVVSDIRMPGLDGPALYRRLADSHPQLRRRFVFLTGDSRETGAAAFLRQSGCPTLEKPFSLDEALDVLRPALSAGGREP